MEGDMLRTQQAYYEDLKREQEEVRGLRHDMMNHLSVIQSLLGQNETAQAQSYLKSLTREFSAPLRVFCENDTVNALLNAKYQQRRLITLKGRCDGRYFSYSIENRAVAGEVLREKGRFVTAKKDSRFHGHGLRIISDIAEELGGTVDISFSGDIFSVTALIPAGKA